MSNLGTAYVLATAIYAGNSEDGVHEDASDAIYQAIDSSNVFATDEAKADVYAQLAECLLSNTPFKDAVELIETALNNTEEHLR